MSVFKTCLLDIPVPQSLYLQMELSNYPYHLVILEQLKELIYVKWSKQCLAYSEISKNVASLKYF